MILSTPYYALHQICEYTHIDTTLAIMMVLTYGDLFMAPSVFKCVYINSDYLMGCARADSILHIQYLVRQLCIADLIRF